MTKRRIQRERTTIRAMIRIYCRDLHGSASGLCPACQELADYAMRRLDKCTFQAAKPTCVRCPIHCYGKDWRERVREVMRYAGPRMILRHPILALGHLIDGWKPVRPHPAARPAKSADSPGPVEPEADRR